MAEDKQYDIVMLGSEFAIISGQNYLNTPSGKLVAHRNIRLTQHIVRQLILSEISAEQLNAYDIFSTVAEHQAQIDVFLKEHLIELIKNDPILKLRNLKANQSYKINNLIDAIENAPYLLNLIIFGSSIILKGLNEFLIENNISPNYDENLEANYALIAELINQLNTELKVCLMLLSHLHKSGILLPFMLLQGTIFADEYANAAITIIFNNSLREEVQIYELVPFQNNNTLPHLDSDIKAENLFDTIRKTTIAINDYAFFLKDDVNPNSPLLQLIKQGESSYLEFKATLRWNIKSAKKDPAIEHATLKTIAAFLNSSGGSLLIGVRDDGSIEGIETDAFSDNDKFLLHLWNLIKSYLGQEFSPFIETKLEKLDCKTVCIVRCLAANRPAFLRQTGFDEEFYIRTGPGSSKLGISDALKYIADRFEIKKS